MLYNNLIYGQCGICSDPNNNIVNNNNGAYTATPADNYFWEICEGSATISGSNTKSTVLVTGSGDYKIKVVRFNNGNCTAACEFFDYIPPGGGNQCTLASCFSNNDFVWWTSTDCKETTVTLAPFLRQVNSQCTDYVDWNWEVNDIPGGRNGEFLNDDLSIVIYHKPYTTLIEVCANVVFQNGIACTEICRSINSNCDGPGPGN